MRTPEGSDTAPSRLQRSTAPVSSSEQAAGGHSPEQAAESAAPSRQQSTALCRPQSSQLRAGCGPQLRAGAFDETVVAVSSNAQSSHARCSLVVYFHKFHQIGVRSLKTTTKPKPSPSQDASPQATSLNAACTNKPVHVTHVAHQVRYLRTRTRQKY